MSSSIVMAVSYNRGKLGAAFYEQVIETVRLLPDANEDADFTVLKNLLHQVRPTHVLASRVHDIRFLMALKRECGGSDPDPTLESIILENESMRDRSLGSSATKPTSEQHALDASRGPPSTSSTLRSGFPEDPLAATGMSGAGSSTDSAKQQHRPQEMQNMTVGCSTTISSDNSAVSQYRKDDSAKDEEVEDGEVADDDVEEGEIDDDLEEGELCEDDEDEGERWQPVFQILSGSAFSFEDGRKRLERMFIHPVHSSKVLTNMRFDAQDTNMIRAIGAVLRYIDQQQIGTGFGTQSQLTVKAIKTIVLDSSVDVDRSTVRALEIFDSDYNPSLLKRKFVYGNWSKKSVSVFGMCNLCRSVPGRLLLRQWFERPVNNRDVLRRRQDGISFFLQDCNLDATARIRGKLKSIVNIRGPLRRMHAGNASVNDWRNIYETSKTMAEIAEYLYEREIKLAIIEENLGLMAKELSHVAELVDGIIDFEGSTEDNRFVVRQGVSQELDRLKEEYEALPERLTHIAQDEANALGIEECSVGYVPIIGYLLIIEENMDETRTDRNDMNLAYTADHMNHYKTDRMKWLDEEYGDLKMQIVDAETTVLLRLQSKLLERHSDLTRAQHVAAVLDCLISLSMVAREHNWCRPKLVEESVIDVNMARNPIAELASKSGFVPNPIMSGGGHPKMRLISGPNASGKSVYLKSVGVIAYLAHVGSFVPAERAVIGPINRIMSRMYTVDSVLNAMSSFATDLKQISAAIRKSDKNSLMIIDEFGKGTMTEVGLSLFASCLNYWLELDLEERPHVIASSHFHSLPTFLSQPETVAFQMMEILRKDDGRIQFQYKLVDGQIDNSYASHTALCMGIPKDIVARADQVYAHLKAGLSIAAVEPKNKDEEQDMEEMASRMDSILDLFHEWDLKEDPVGFVEMAVPILRIDEDEFSADGGEHQGGCSFAEESETQKAGGNVDDGSTTRREETTAASADASPLEPNAKRARFMDPTDFVMPTTPMPNAKITGTPCGLPTQATSCVEISQPGAVDNTPAPKNPTENTVRPSGTSRVQTPQRASPSVPRATTSSQFRTPRPLQPSPSSALNGTTAKIGIVRPQQRPTPRVVDEIAVPTFRTPRALPPSPAMLPPTPMPENARYVSPSKLHISRLSVASRTSSVRPSQISDTSNVDVQRMSETSMLRYLNVPGASSARASPAPNSKQAPDST